MDLAGFASALKLLRSMRLVATEIILEWTSEQEEPSSIKPAKVQLEQNIDLLRDLLPSDFPSSQIGDLARHIHFAERHDFHDIVIHDIPDVEAKLETYIRQGKSLPGQVGFEELLDPLIADAGLKHYRTEDFRLAVVEATTALFDLIRERTGLQEDGDALAGRVFNDRDPMLQVASDLDTQTGRTTQRGFMLLCQGAYARFRNPRAHTRAKEVQRISAAQELVCLSRLAKSVRTAKLVKKVS